MSIEPPTSRATFPEPLPAYLQRNTVIPEASPPVCEPLSANAGRFTSSIKGARKELRRSGHRAQRLVEQIETELVGWLSNGGTIIAPQSPDGLTFPGRTVGIDTIREVSRTPLKLVWRISEDGLARFVVHLVARYHEVVSFSEPLHFGDYVL